jgi:DNA-binding transcriptional LysR family regulator
MAEVDKGRLQDTQRVDRLDAMRAFVVTVDQGSLAAGARRLGYSAAAVTRGIAQLEARLGMVLLHRSTRALHLTSFGESYLATCREILAALDQVERGVAAEQEKPTGLLTITAPLMFGQLHVRPVLDAFLDANPAVRGRLLLLDRVANIVEEGIDVAVRVAHLPDSQLKARRLGEVRRVLCAAPSYLDLRGAPTEPRDLAEHDCIMERDGAEIEAWRFSSTTIAVRPRLVVNSAAAAVASAAAGHGVTRVMSYQAAGFVAAGELIVLLPDHEPPPIPVQFVLPPTRRDTAKLKAFLAYAIPALQKALGEVARTFSLSGSSRL